VRIILVLFTALLAGCDYGFTFHPEEMTPDQMLNRAELVFIGVIQAQHFDSWPFFRPPIAPNYDNRDYANGWHPLRRSIRVETILRGNYNQAAIDIYEIFAPRGGSGDWNATSDNRRYLFMVRRVNGRWQVVRDFRRSIYPIDSGYHSRLPLDQSHPFWERYALINYWVSNQIADDPTFLQHPPLVYHLDPGSGLSAWRKAKLLRGILRHPQLGVRRLACFSLFYLGASDSCIGPSGHAVEQTWDSDRIDLMRRRFDELLSETDSRSADLRENIDRLRFLTAVNHDSLRREFCQKFMAKFPNDTDNGCPADKPLPATIVTDDGDAPLVGRWPTATGISTQ
jgi:hypothetical protein